MPCAGGSVTCVLIRVRTALFLGSIGFLCLSACTTVPERSGLLSDYSRQAPFDGRLSKRAAARPSIVIPDNAPLVLESIIYAPEAAAESGLSDGALDLVLNRFARDLCVTLAGRFEISDERTENQYRLRAFITEIRPTGRVAAAISIPLAYFSPVGGRLPIGLGALSTEVELLGPDGVQVASMTWRRAANAVNSASVSPISDAYALAGEAAESFSQIVAGKGSSRLDRFRSSGLIPDLSLGGEEVECVRYGRGPGLLGEALGFSPVGVPPEWLDRGRLEMEEVSYVDSQITDAPSNDQGNDPETRETPN